MYNAVRIGLPEPDDDPSVQMEVGQAMANADAEMGEGGGRRAEAWWCFRARRGL